MRACVGVLVVIVVAIWFFCCSNFFEGGDFRRRIVNSSGKVRSEQGIRAGASRDANKYERQKQMKESEDGDGKGG